MISARVNSKQLNQVIRDLDRLYPKSDTKLRNTLRTALRKSAAPLRKELRNQIKSSLKSTSKEKSTGQLVRSIGIINGKTKGGRQPSVFVGPRVKGSFSNIKKSGFYFFFLEYGKVGLSPRRMLDKTSAAVGEISSQMLLNNVADIVTKRWAKRR